MNDTNARERESIAARLDTLTARIDATLERVEAVERRIAECTRSLEERIHRMEDAVRAVALELEQLDSDMRTTARGESLRAARPVRARMPAGSGLLEDVREDLVDVPRYVE